MKERYGAQVMDKAFIAQVMVMVVHKNSNQKRKTSMQIQQIEGSEGDTREGADTS